MWPFRRRGREQEPVGRNPAIINHGVRIYVDGRSISLIGGRNCVIVNGVRVPQRLLRRGWLRIAEDGTLH